MAPETGLRPRRLDATISAAITGTAMTSPLNWARFLIPAILVIAAVAGFPAQAADVPVDLELALGIDVSGSVDDEEAVLQRNG
jgi:hypothetical protein